MTFRDRYMQEHSEAEFNEIKFKDCPFMYGYCDKSDCLNVNGNCKHECDCIPCWNRENFDDCRETETTNMNLSKMKKAELIEQINALNDELEKLEKYKRYEDSADEMRAFFDVYINRGFSTEDVFRLMEIAAKIGR